MRVRNLSFIAIIATFTLLMLGGFVHNTQSSLACPDWPLCYGQLFPKMEGGILIEHSHRLLATLVGIFTIGLVYFSSKDRNKSEDHLKLFKISSLALFLVILQGVLGGITVLYRLPTIVSTSHLSLSLIFFSILIYINHRASFLENKNLTISFSKKWNPSIRHGILFAAVILFSQIVLGAFMRHSGAGISCGLGANNSILCMDVTTWKQSWWPDTPQSQLHMIHRLYAIFVSVVVTFFSLRSFFYFNENRKLQFQSILPIIFIIFQVFIGIIAVALNLVPIPTTLHLAGAALSLASLWKLNLVIQNIEISLSAAGNFNSHSLFSDFLDLTKPRLSLLVMVTVLGGILVAPGHIYFFTALLSFVLIGLVVAGGATLNCYIERNTDSKMQRTKDRPLPAKRMRPQTALIFGIILLAISLPAIFLFINIITGLLATIAALLYLFAYTPLKTKSELAVFVGAIPGAIPPLLGWTTVTGKIDGMGLSLFAILFIWQLPHFLAISIYHADDYGAADVKTYPNQQGIKLTKIAIFALTAVLFATSLMPTYFAEASIIYTRAAFSLSTIFLVLAFKGILLDKSDLTSIKIWAKTYFYGSIFYLPLLLAALIFFK
jgi:protoheme IX farnesyltransferase